MNPAKIGSKLALQAATRHLANEAEVQADEWLNDDVQAVEIQDLRNWISYWQECVGHFLHLHPELAAEADRMAREQAEEPSS